MKVQGDGRVCRKFLTQNFSMGRQVTTVSASTLTLTSFSPSIQIFTGVVPGQILNLGDTLLYPTEGLSYFVLNDSDESLSVEDFSNNEIKELPARFGDLFILQDGTTNDGIWRVMLFLDNDQSFVSDAVAPPVNFDTTGVLNNNEYCLNGNVPSNIVGAPIAVSSVYFAVLYPA